MAPVTFWGNVRRIRLARKMSQKAFARALGHVDASNSNISTWELHDPRVPDPDLVLRVAAVLNISPAALFVDEKNRPIETVYDILRRAPDVETARQDLKQFAYRRRKPAAATATAKAPEPVPHFRRRAQASDRRKAPGLR